MTSLPNLHDGFFDGLWLSGDKQVYLFVRTVEGERSTIHLTEAEALNISGLRAGNIIFDVVLIPPDKLTIEDMNQVYDLKDSETESARQLLVKAQQQGLFALEINSSYGPQGMVLCVSISTLPGHVLAQVQNSS